MVCVLESAPEDRQRRHTPLLHSVLVAVTAAVAVTAVVAVTVVTVAAAVMAADWDKAFRYPTGSIVRPGKCRCYQEFCAKAGQQRKMADMVASAYNCLRPVRLDGIVPLR